eukprot:Gb_22993 [translate_table: standard]
MGSAEERNYIEHRAYARVGLLGNPSDVYNGRTLSFALANFWTVVCLRRSESLVIEPHPHHDLVKFSSLDHLRLYGCLGQPGQPKGRHRQKKLPKGSNWGL